MSIKEIADKVYKSEAVVLTTKKAEVEAIVKATFEELKSAVSLGEEVKIFGFGSFSTTLVGKRAGRNPKTGETVEIPAGARIKFKPAKAFKESVSA